MLKRYAVFRQKSSSTLLFEVALESQIDYLVLARLAKIKLAFLSTQKETVERTIKAYLAEDDSVPLLLGIEDLLTNARLVSDYPKNKAFLQV